MSQLQAIIEQPVNSSLKIVSIERRAAKTLNYEAFVREYVNTNRPVIIEDAVPQWKALETWTPEYFRRRFGAETVNVTYGTSMNFAELIEAILASNAEKPGPYLHKVIIHKDMPALLPDLTPENEYGFPGRYCSPLMPKHWQRPDGYLKLLMGGVGGKFPLMHYDTDNANAFITEIYGDKEFVLFSPEDTPKVYPTPGSEHTCQIDDLDHPDLKRFPLFAQALQYRGIIGPGEMIFVPSHWWHSARVVTTSISVCTNMIGASSWQGFVDEACAPITGSWASRTAKRIYLQFAGFLMSMAERFQSWLPNTGIARLASRLSPAEARYAADRF
jgi:Cupin-like domain